MFISEIFLKIIWFCSQRGYLGGARPHSRSAKFGRRLKPLVICILVSEDELSVISTKETFEGPQNRGATKFPSTSVWNYIFWAETFLNISVPLSWVLPCIKMAFIQADKIHSPLGSQLWSLFECFHCHWNSFIGTIWRDFNVLLFYLQWASNPSGRYVLLTWLTNTNDPSWNIIKECCKTSC